MALKELTLESLAETKLGPLFRKAMNEVLFSLYEEADITGKRSLTIDIVFEPKNDGLVITTLECSHKVPGRKVSSFATLENHGIKIDTVSGDARQGDLLEATGTNVTSITEAPSSKKEQAS